MDHQINSIMGIAEALFMVCVLTSNDVNVTVNRVGPSILSDNSYPQDAQARSRLSHRDKFSTTTGMAATTHAHTTGHLPHHLCSDNNASSHPRAGLIPLPRVDWVTIECI